RLVAMLLVAIGLLLHSMVVLAIWKSAAQHSADIGEPAFQMSNFVRLFPVLGSAALSLEYFGLIWWTCILAIPAALYFKDRVGVQLSLVVAAYALIYALHARHRAFAAGATVNPAEMIRYVFVASPLAVVLIGRCLSLAILAKKERTWIWAKAACWSI